MSAVQKRSHVEVVVDATVPQVWSVVSDVTRVGEWSHECRGAEWLGDADGPLPACASEAATGRAGRAGRDGAGPREIVALDPPSEIVWRTVPTRLIPDSTEWRIRLEPADRGTRITQTFDGPRAPPGCRDRLYARLLPAHQDRDARLADDLRRIGEVARAGSQTCEPAADAHRQPDRCVDRTGGPTVCLMGGGKVLMLTVPGRRTGLPRSTCVRFLETDEGLVVWGTGSGATRDPDWFRNLRVAEIADVQVGGDRFRARPRGTRRRRQDGDVERHDPGPGARGRALRPQGRPDHPGRGPAPHLAFEDLFLTRVDEGGRHRALRRMLGAHEQKGAP